MHTHTNTKCRCIKIVSHSQIINTCVVTCTRLFIFSPTKTHWIQFKIKVKKTCRCSLAHLFEIMERFVRKCILQCFWIRINFIKNVQFRVPKNKLGWILEKKKQTEKYFGMKAFDITLNSIFFFYYLIKLWKASGIRKTHTCKCFVHKRRWKKINVCRQTITSTSFFFQCMTNKTRHLTTTKKMSYTRTKANIDDIHKLT